MNEEFETHIEGISCRIKVTTYTPYNPGVSWGPPEQCYPPEGGDFDYEIISTSGDCSIDELQQLISSLSLYEKAMLESRLFNEYEEYMTNAV